VRGPAGVARPDWEIFAALARAMDADLGLSTLTELQEEAGGLLASREAPARPSAWAAAGRPALVEGLTLFSYPLLVDEGRLSRDAFELKAALEERPFVEVHPHDCEKLGLADGGRALVTTEAGEATVVVRVTEHVAEGSVFLPFNQPGLSANELLSGRFTTGARLAPAPAAVEPAPVAVGGEA